jgi:hypothetical protein
MELDIPKMLEQTLQVGFQTYLMQVQQVLQGVELAVIQPFMQKHCIYLDRGEQSSWVFKHVHNQRAVDRQEMLTFLENSPEMADILNTDLPGLDRNVAEMLLECAELKRQQQEGEQNNEPS